ncbi:Serine hydrolase FSH [Penicillium riverlandense]|uniref:Serine hydrolase FSH n=1 Tax=Penicillium riverlandense TaxID=1903569 RepID=UPI002546DDFA|nr:Serine hydrolase FSH [Penicillium riverlandense]KAJ5820607.1 Serine hydrolase FSH [Penicillium riverlandense]
MRFLCLHGAGTNAEILEIQTGGLRQQLEKKGHRFIFVNGRQDAQVESGMFLVPQSQAILTREGPELEGIFDGPFYNHYPRGPTPGAGVFEAFEHTYRIISEQGPFDAVMGFSQGAALAAALIIHHGKVYPHAPPLFRAAVFLCGGCPFDRSGMAYITPQPDTYTIPIPTAHIVGKLDPLYPQSMKLHGLCEPSKAALYDHGSKHMVPFDAKNTDEMARAIEETVARAFST